MKFTLLFLALASTLAASLLAGARELVKKWETEPSLRTPESVLYDAVTHVLYVSNIDGKEPWTKDGKGSIAKVGIDGKVIDATWVSGLEAPKGLGLHNGRLFVADIDVVVVIDIAKAAIAEKIAIAGAQNLNDITVGQSGAIYVSDSRTAKAHVIKDGKPALFLEGIKGVNGLLAHDKDFYVLASGALFKVGDDKKLNKIVDEIEGHVDGIEHVEGNEFIVSCWNGLIYSINGSDKKLLLDTRAQNLQAADIGYNAQQRIVYVPTFFTNTVAAYELK